MTQSFGERLERTARQRGRLCVGIDPHGALLHAWGLPDNPRGLAEFCRLCVTAFADTAALVKPQVAFFERFGSEGFAVLEETIGELRCGGALVVADAKRGDIGSTMAGYADAWLRDGSPLAVDAVTVSPYLGVGSLLPAVHAARDYGRGLFVLAATSNPEARQLQDGGVSQAVVDAVASWGQPGRNHAPETALADYGVVIGATLTAESMPRCEASGAVRRMPVLMPGVGAQGGRVERCDELLAGQNAIAFPNVSRAVLQAGPNVTALRAAVCSWSQRMTSWPSE